MRFGGWVVAQCAPTLLGDHVAVLVAVGLQRRDEPAGTELLWRGYTQGETFTPKVWNDAFLSAFAEAAAYELVTFDKGFTRYTNLNCTILS